MALVKRPECEKEISSAAAACPHCGNPLKPPASPKSKGSGCAIVAAVCLGAMALIGYCDYHPSESAKQTEPPKLNGAFSSRGAAFELTNNDEFDWSNCDLKINYELLGSDGYQIVIPSVNSREVRTISAMELANNDGQRFEPVTHKAKKVYIECDTPRGKADTGWEFKDE